MGSFQGLLAGIMGLSGFLGNRSTFMLDVVVVALFAVLPTLLVSILVVRRARNYQLHKRLQTTMAYVLLITVLAFEIDIRTSDWEALATPASATEPPARVYAMLYVHLVFAVSTVALWAWVLWRAHRRFPKPPGPSQHSRAHAFWGYVAAFDMLGTAVTGWIFYWMAFVD